MDRRSFIHSTGLAVLAITGRLIAPVRAEERAAPKDLGDLLEAIRKEHKLPGLAAAVVRRDQIVAEGVAGARQVGKDDKIALEDRFPIGSCTKRMTGLMIGRVIDSGKLSFDTTLAEVLPDIKMRDEYRKVTVAQLLSFTGGIQPYTQINPRLTPILFELKGAAPEQREQFIKHLLQEEPVVKPGSEKRYSNASYALAAFVASRRTRREWETLLEEEVFKPLGLTKAGFGRPRSKERPNEPWLHSKGAALMLKRPGQRAAVDNAVDDKEYQPEPEERRSIEALAAAGNVHCSIRDFAKFASFELLAIQGKNSLLKPATAKRWQELSQDEQADGRAVFGGSPFSTAGYVLWSSKNMAAVVAVNGGSAREACEALFKTVRERHF